MGKIQVNPSTGKVLVIRDSSGISKLCSNCCVSGPPYPTEPDICCPGWGENLTPSQYTVKIEDVVDCPFAGAVAVNGTWVLELIECGTPAEEWGCTWQYKEAEEVGNVWVVIVRNHSIACATIQLTAFFWNNGWKVSFFQNASYTKTTGFCDTLANNQVICDGLRWGRFGQATFWPGDWPAWIITTGYNLDDRVENNDVLYVCIVPHTAAASNEPGVGVDWTDVWEVSDPCGDANVACP